MNGTKLIVILCGKIYNSKLRGTFSTLGGKIFTGSLAAIFELTKHQYIYMCVSVCVCIRTLISIQFPFQCIKN